MGQLIPEIIAASIGALVSAIIAYYLGGVRERQKWEREREQTAQERVRQVLSVCNRLAIYTKMHAQMKPDAMFLALEDCRTSLQQLSDLVEPENQKRLVRDIIAQLLYIRERKKAYEAADDPAVREIREEEIDTAKRNIIGNLVEVSKLANMAYDLPRDLTQRGVFFTVEEANQPLSEPRVNDGEDLAGADPLGPQQSSRDLDYTQVNENFRRLADIRFKLLAFVPALGGVAIYVLTTSGLSAEGAPRQPTDDVLWLVALIAATGFIVTLGIIFYDQRNSELYNALIHRAKFLEREFEWRRSPNAPTAGADGGQFNERPSRGRHLFGIPLFEMAHDTGLALIYGPVLGAWFFPFLLTLLKLNDYSWPTSLRGACIAAVVASLLFTGELLRQDYADKKRWRSAGAGGAGTGEAGAGGK